MLRTKHQVATHFFRWVYSMNTPAAKFRNESLLRAVVHEHYDPSVILMRDWHNHISASKFALYMENLGEPYKECKAIAKEILGKKRVEEMLGI